MAIKGEKSTTTLERGKQDTLFDLIDKKFNEQRNVTELDVQMARFDHSYDANKLNEVYDEIDREQLEEAEIPVRDEAEPATDTVANPFFGDPDGLNKLRRGTYHDVVDAPRDIPTLEIKAYDKARTKPKGLSKRAKLWISAGACCGVLMISLLVVNAFSISSLNNNISNLEQNVNAQQSELASLNGQYENLSGPSQDYIDQNHLRPMDPNKAQNVDLTPENTVTHPKPPSNLFDKICAFFARLFGR